MKNDESSADGEHATSVNTNRSLNISIYLDLSDRLIRDMTPSQKDKDIHIVNYMAEILKKHSVAQKILPSQDRIKVFFYPAPNDSKISLLSNDLEMDLSKLHTSTDIIKSEFRFDCISRRARRTGSSHA